MLCVADIDTHVTSRYYSCTSVNGRSDVGGANCNDTTLNPYGCSYIMPNASYAKEVHLQRTPSQLMRKIRAGYAGGITWTDMQIGKVLNALDATGKAKDTVVMYWPDHVREASPVSGRYGCNSYSCGWPTGWP